MQDIILIGGGGHCKVVIDAILAGKKYKIKGIIDLKEKIGKKILGIPIIGEDGDIKDYFNKGIKNCFIAVGSTGDMGLRKRLFNSAQRLGFSFPNVIHPFSSVSRFAVLGYGNYIASAVIINAGVNIGNNCIINTGAIIDHDCNIGDFVHIAPGVTMSGGVEIGSYSHIGPGVSISQYKKVGGNSIIGSGSLVIDDIESNVVAYGNPCRRMKNNG